MLEYGLGRLQEIYATLIEIFCFFFFPAKVHRCLIKTVQRQLIWLRSGHLTYWSDPLERGGPSWIDIVYKCVIVWRRNDYNVQGSTGEEYLKLSC